MERLVGLQLLRGARVLSARPRPLLLVIPEARCAHLALERVGARLQPSGVKDSPRAASTGRGSPHGAAASAPTWCWRRWTRPGGYRPGRAERGQPALTPRD